MTIDELRNLIKDVDGSLTLAISYDDENGSCNELFPLDGYKSREYFILTA